MIKEDKPKSKLLPSILIICVSSLIIALIIPYKKETPIRIGEDSMPEKEKIEPFKVEPLTPEEKDIILAKGTEPPNSGKYNKFQEKGVYVCRQCGTPLFRSINKFDSGCGWPAFEKEIPGTVKLIPDPDGRRTEIVCKKCGGHLGHVFIGENYTQKNTRHCVNSISLKFIPEEQIGRAIFASGCFWGTEYYLEKAPGVLQTTVGYIGGKKSNPTYEQVCDKETGHAEAVEVLFDPKKTNFEKLAKLFFETHDPGELNRQGPDIGEQYRSEIFYTSEEQKKIAEELIKRLKKRGVNVVTKVTKAGQFWDAEDYHQDYYKQRGGKPYCHTYRKKFD